MVVWSPAVVGVCVDLTLANSLGVAMGLRGYGMCQMRGISRSAIFLKNAKGRMYYIFNLLTFFNFFKV